MGLYKGSLVTRASLTGRANAAAFSLGLRMPIPEKDYIDRLREADQRAVDVLAKANAERVKHNMLVISILVSIASLLVAVVAVLYKANH